jgi:hypothetical protein
MIRRIAERLAKTEYVRGALEDPTELKDIWREPDARMMVGLFLVGFSYIIGWPAVAALGILAVYFREPLIALIGGPTIYGLSHLVFLAGAWLAGAGRARIMMRYVTKVLFRKILNHDTKPFPV